MLENKRLFAVFTVLSLILNCKQIDTRTVRIDNVMCRTKPDINSKIVEIFSKGTLLNTRPTNVKFTFMEITDVWHEVVDKKCYTFGGLLEATSTITSPTTKNWYVRELLLDPHGIESYNKTNLRPKPMTQHECQAIVKAFEAERQGRKTKFEKWFKEKEADCASRGIESVSDCGLPLEGSEDMILSCVQQ